MKKFNTIWGLILTYIGMVAVCMYLNIQSSDLTDYKSISISIGMFVIVGLIFIYSAIRFGKIKKIVFELNTATKKIEDDHNSYSVFLWSKYRAEGNTNIFPAGMIQKYYEDFIHEMNRLEIVSTDNCKCNIEDYINKEYIDDILKKNLLNMIPGAMTGLGILGTFIGLSFGLQEFNTTNSETIADSIAPLMDGIKVAFHTSIYGMVFSLLFNLIYKYSAEEAYVALDRFLSAFNKYVCPDSENENINKSLDYQRKTSLSNDEISLKISKAIEPQLTDINNNIKQLLEEQKAFNQMLAKSMGLIDTNQKANLSLMVEMSDKIQGFSDSIGEKIAFALDPQFTKIHESFSQFAARISDNQLEGVGVIIDKFLSEMDRALGDNFTRLADIIAKTCDLQEQNSAIMQKTLDQITNTVDNLLELNALSEDTIKGLDAYVNKLDNLQTMISEDVTSMHIQNEHNNEIADKLQSYIEQLVGYELRIADSSSLFTQKVSEQISLLTEMKQALDEGSQDSLEQFAQKSSAYLEKLDEMVRQQISEIKSLTSDTSDELSLATEAIKTATAEFEKGMNESMVRNFDQIDVIVSDIVDHLSSTISSINTTTEKVPHTVARAYEGMGEGMTRLEKQIEELANQIEKMNSEVPEVSKEWINEAGVNIGNSLTQELKRSMESMIASEKNEFHDLKNELLDSLRNQ